jgi:hypothetical protein
MELRGEKRRKSHVGAKTPCLDAGGSQTATSYGQFLHNKVSYHRRFDALTRNLGGARGSSQVCEDGVLLAGICLGAGNSGVLCGMGRRAKPRAFPGAAR